MALNLETLDPALQLYTTREAAEILKVTPRRIRGLIKAGQLPASCPNGTWLISKADLLACLDSSRNVPRQKAPGAAGEAAQETEAEALTGDTAGAKTAARDAAAAETAGD